MNQPNTNITRQHEIIWERLLHGGHGPCYRLELLSCFANGKPSVAIVSTFEQAGLVRSIPHFVSITPDVEITDHDGNPVPGPVD